MSADNPYRAPQAAAKVEDSAVPAGSWFLRVAGAILAAFGLFGAWLLSLGVRRMLEASLPDLSLSFGFGILTLITAFCLYVGVKLLFEIRHVRGSLMGPIAWYSVGVCIGGVCAVVAISSLLNRGPTAWATALFTLACGGVFCAGCILAARGWSPRHPYSLPPAEVDLDAGADASVWVEIHNDDHTPMEFVVTGLCEVFAMSRERAIALMLRVHRDGRARVPCASIEEARQRATQMTERARASGHPLTCEAGQLRLDDSANGAI